MPINQYNDFNGSEQEYPGLRKDVMNYIYCYESTCDSAAKACKKFTSLGYKVKEIKGGFEQWQEYKLPVER